MKSFGNAIIYGAGLVLGGCIIYFVIWPWIRSW